MNKKDIEDIMNEFKNFSPEEKDVEKISTLADEYRDKSKEEIFFEIIKVNEDMENSMSEEEYNKIFEKLESMRPFLNEEQVEKLDELLYILGK